AGDHPRIGTMYDVAAERRARRLKLGDERVQILDFESDRAARGGARLVCDEICERDTAAARQVILDPPFVALVTVQADLQSERLFVEPPRTRDVADRVHRERDLLEHEQAPFTTLPLGGDFLISHLVATAYRQGHRGGRSTASIYPCCS